MEVKHVELGGVRTHLVQHQHVIRHGIAYGGVEPQRLGAARHEIGGGDGITIVQALAMPLEERRERHVAAAQDPNDPGVLILSRFAGAAVDGKRALLVNPYDAESVAAAIVQALAMPLEERRERHVALLQGFLKNNVNKWQNDFLDALRDAGPPADQVQASTKTSILDRPVAMQSGAARRWCSGRCAAAR
jgi:hypothetical protein